MRPIEANYCARCGKPVIDSYNLTWDDDERKMRENAAPSPKDMDRCVRFHGEFELNAGDSIDFSEIGRQMKPISAEVYIHKSTDEEE